MGQQIFYVMTNELHNTHSLDSMPQIIGDTKSTKFAILQWYLQVSTLALGINQFRVWWFPSIPSPRVKWLESATDHKLPPSTTVQKDTPLLPHTNNSIPCHVPKLLKWILWSHVYHSCSVPGRGLKSWSDNCLSWLLIVGVFTVPSCSCRDTTASLKSLQIHNSYYRPLLNNFSN